MLDKVQSKKDREKYLRIEKLKNDFRKNPVDLEGYFAAITLQIQFLYDDFEDIIDSNENYSSSSEEDENENDLPSLAFEILKVILTTLHQYLAKLLEKMKTNLHRVLAHLLLLIYILPLDVFHQIFVNF